LELKKRNIKKEYKFKLDRKRVFFLSKNPANSQILLYFFANEPRKFCGLSEIRQMAKNGKELAKI
jgi:hypothetical protein